MARPVKPWYRSIYAHGVAVGFVMIAEVTPAHPEPYLWRLLIDRHHQGRGIGRAALAALARRLRSEGAERSDELGRRPWRPRAVLPRLGFVPTGEMDGTEVVARLEL
jgi:diamine N-acetyltransferase